MAEQAGVLRRNVRARREAAGLSREQLAGRSDVTASTIFRIESDDDYEPRMSSVRSIAEALGCQIVDLFTEPKPDQPEAAAS